jgi:hypothetical protein
MPTPHYIGGHVFLGLMVGFVALSLERYDIAKAQWLSLALVLLIGFGTCMIINN